MTLDTIGLRVSSIRSVKKWGAIFVGSPIDTTTGLVTDAKAFVVVKAEQRALGGLAVQIGMWFEVQGCQTRTEKDFNGFRRTEIGIKAESIRFLRPSGEHLVRFLADCHEFAGIGIAKARRLWDTFGEELYGHLDRGETGPLLAVLTPESAKQLIDAWRHTADGDTIRFLQAKDFDLRVAKRVVSLFGKDTKRRIEEDPYRLLSFSASWRETDLFALQNLGISPDDPRRLQAACEEALYRHFAAGHTTSTSASLKKTMASLLQPSTGTVGQHVIEDSLRIGHSNGTFIVHEDGLIQTIGAAVMERTVAKAVTERIIYPAAPLLWPADIQRVISEFEQAERLTLSTEQRLAVETVAANRIACISGGAGVGKTTVLKAVLAVVEAAGLSSHLIALAGRAAKRMTEATGKPAVTIASFLRKTDTQTLENSILVIDEASMVDIISMAELTKLLPESCRLVFVGDEGQLMPVGPGLIFHALVAKDGIPKVKLATARRFGQAIASVANAVRAGQWPTVSDDATQAIAFIPEASPSAIAERIIELYSDSPEDTQIICAKKSGPDGTRALNAAIQARINPDGQPLKVFDGVHEQFAYSGLRLNDVVLCSRNIYEQDLRNGSLGRIVELVGQPEENGEKSAIAWILWDDGVRRPAYEDLLDDIELGYAVTIHKAQGSQWSRVLIPISRARNLDRSMIYTAITRAQHHAILVGQPETMVTAVAEHPKSHWRSVGLGLTIERILRDAT